MAKSDELVKYITQRVVTYIDKPKAVRRLERQSRVKPKEPWAVRWFGMLPMALGMWIRQARGGREERSAVEAALEERAGGQLPQTAHRKRESTISHKKKAPPSQMDGGNMRNRGEKSVGEPADRS